MCNIRKPLLDYEISLKGNYKTLHLSKMGEMDIHSNKFILGDGEGDIEQSTVDCPNIRYSILTNIMDISIIFRYKFN